jgi:CMP-N-acetylneuraminic acid synthetase
VGDGGAAAYPAKPRRLAIVPARGGSKGVPGKNLAEIGGQSLLARAVACARDTGLFETILVSTDDPAIAAEGERAGAAVPFLRPATLAGDKAAVVDAVRDVLRRQAADGARFDLVALIEPTSPCRTAEIVRAVVAAAEGEGADAALSLSPVPTHFHALKQFVLGEGGAVGFAAAGAERIVNRQELRPTLIRNGMAYAVRVAALDAGHGILGSRPYAVVVDGEFANIDAPEDLEAARRLIAEGVTPRVRATD